MTPVDETGPSGPGLGPGPRCKARMAYQVTAPDPAAPETMARTEQRSARCHLEEGHPGNHRATIPVPGKRGRRYEFRQGAHR